MSLCCGHQVMGLHPVRTFSPPPSPALLLGNVRLTHSFNQRSSPRPPSPLPLMILIFYNFSLEETCK